MRVKHLQAGGLGFRGQGLRGLRSKVWDQRLLRRSKIRTCSCALGLGIEKTVPWQVAAALTV